MLILLEATRTLLALSLTIMFWLCVWLVLRIGARMPKPIEDVKQRAAIVFEAGSLFIVYDVIIVMMEVENVVENRMSYGIVSIFSEAITRVGVVGGSATGQKRPHT